MHPIRGAARTWAARAARGIDASHAGEGMENMRAAEGIEASAQLLWDLWQWPSQNACRATRWQEAWTDLIEPLQRVDGHLAAGSVERPARGMVAGAVAAGLEVAAGTRGTKQNAQTVRRVSEQDVGREEAERDCLTSGWYWAAWFWSGEERVSERLPA